MKINEIITETETYQPPELHTGDKILKGKFKNSPATIKGFSKDKHNQPVLKTDKGAVQLFKPRVTKLMTSEGKTITGLNIPLYHGGSQAVTKFKIPPHGVFFSPHIEWASQYGKVITTVKVNAAKVYVLDHNNRLDMEILDALFDRDYETVAKAVQHLAKQGYHAMQTQTDSEMVCVFPGTKIQVVAGKEV